LRCLHLICATRSCSGQVLCSMGAWEAARMHEEVCRLGIVGSRAGGFQLKGLLEKLEVCQCTLPRCLVTHHSDVRDMAAIKNAIQKVRRGVPCMRRACELGGGCGKQQQQQQQQQEKIPATHCWEGTYIESTLLAITLSPENLSCTGHPTATLQCNRDST
jgi:hypothetical protein